MNDLGVILQGAVAITFIFAGFSKLIWIKQSSDFASNLGIFPKRVGAILGFYMPLIELFVGIGMLFTKIVYIKILALGIIMFFIGINLKAILEKKDLQCFCYGNILKSKLSKGGLVHYLYLLSSLLMSFIFLNSNIPSAFQEYLLINKILVICAIILIFINGIVMQLVLDI